MLSRNDKGTFGFDYGGIRFGPAPYGTDLPAAWLQAVGSLKRKSLSLPEGLCLFRPNFNFPSSSLLLLEEEERATLALSDPSNFS